MKKVLMILTGLVLMTSCGPSKEEMLEAHKNYPTQKYPTGSVVYLKPDSCAGVITCYSFIYTNYPIYSIRDCRGNNIEMKEEFIYGLKTK